MTMTPETERTNHRRLLPMAGHTKGGRSPVTCHLRCGDACAQPVPNRTEGPTFRDVVEDALSRRAVLRGIGATAAVAAIGGAGTALAPPAAAGSRSGSAGGRPGAGSGPKLSVEFAAIAPVVSTVDELTVPKGWRWDPIIRWGDPVLRGAPRFDPEHQTAAAQAGQFGYNNDYLDIIVTDRRGTRALLVCNHEYTNENIMFPPEMDAAEKIRIAWAAHGMSVVELRRRHRGEPWTYVPGAGLNRRITLDTPFKVDGPAAGSPLLRTKEDPTGRVVRGTMNNCAGGTTPWGSVLSGEENFNQYFKATGTSARESRYGLSATQDARNWRAVDPRWDATTPDYANEPNRFGWVIEVDPYDPTAAPVKHTAMGRFKHEGANVVVNGDGRVVAYMGDDERFDYVYRFVSKEKYRRGSDARSRKHNLRLLSEGDLSVARFTGDGLEDGVSDGSGQWIPLTRDGRSMVPGFTLEEVLVFTRLAADAVQPTKMDRPEDVEPNLRNGRVYIACTNNTDRGKAGKEGPTEPNPRNANKDGHVVELIPRHGDHTAEHFTWNLLLVCGDPKTAGTYFGGYTGEVSPISCPDNLAFDSRGQLWISTDGAPSTMGTNDGLFHVTLEGKERGRVRQFLSVPTGAETCGPVVHDRDESVFVAVQHPGEDGSWSAQKSRFPDYVAAGTKADRGDFAGPRPTVVQATRSRRRR
jgi:secreted PhoX family phosphatase